MKLYNTLSLCLILGLSGVMPKEVLANNKTDKIWKNELKNQGIKVDDQAYCYVDENVKKQGLNIDKTVRLASVSKLLTSLWSIEKLGLEYKYDTKLYIKNNNLHIKGSSDPFLGDEKMYFLISQLNELGYKKFDTITFDKNLLIYPDVAFGEDADVAMDSVAVGKRIEKYFNTKSWSDTSKEVYSEYLNFAQVGRYRNDVIFEAAHAKIVDSNPYEGDATAKVLTLSSPSLYKYLKQMNITSNNYVAETVFRQSGGITDFTKFLNDRFKLTSEKIRFYSGSGLPTYIDKVRYDNYATCSVVLDLINALKKSIEKQGKEIEDIVAVPGSDRGTFKNRTFSNELENSFVAKTGTLTSVSTLAGAMNTQSGFSFFGIFNESDDIRGAKIVQNKMVETIISELGGPKAFNYLSTKFHSYNGDNVKSFGEYSEFSSIEENLH